MHKEKAEKPVCQDKISYYNFFMLSASSLTTPQTQKEEGHLPVLFRAKNMKKGLFGDSRLEADKYWLEQYMHSLKPNQSVWYEETLTNSKGDNQTAIRMSLQTTRDQDGFCKVKKKRKQANIFSYYCC